MIECETCQGTGERWLGTYEWDTGAPIMAPCGECSGCGEVDPRWSVDYTTQGWERPA